MNDYFRERECFQSKSSFQSKLNSQKHKNKYCNKVLGELEAYTYHPMEEWGKEQFDEVFDLLGAVDNELKASYDEYVEQRDGLGKLTKCVLCGELTHGSVGKAGIKWSMICQKCKDKEDTALLNSYRPIKQLVDMVDDLAEWLGVPEKDNGGIE